MLCYADFLLASCFYLYCCLSSITCVYQCASGWLQVLVLCVVDRMNIDGTTVYYHIYNELEKNCGFFQQETTHTTNAYFAPSIL